MDRLRTCVMKNMTVPAGSPITFQGKEIGQVIRTTEEGNTECAINSDIINSWIKEEKCSYSLEVVHK